MIPRSGRIFEWFRDMTGQSDIPYSDMMQEIIGNKGFDCLRKQSSGTDFFSSGINLSAENSGRAELGRAIVESIGLMVFDALQNLKRNGFPVTEMRLSGGQAKNPLWNQLKANISGCTLHVPEIIDAELAGNACLALIHLGEAGNLDEACKKIVKIKESFYSDQHCHEHYLEQFQSCNNTIREMEVLFS
jgi:xylulokinase